MANPTILVVESNLSVAQEIEAQLKVLGYAVCASVQRGVQAIQTISEVRPDLVLVDINLEGAMEGDEVAEEIYCRFNIPVVYLIDSAKADSLEQGKISKVFGHVFQPLNIHQLRLSIEHCLYCHEKSLEYTEMEAQLNQTISELHDRIQRLEIAEVELKQTVQELQEQTQLMETIFHSISDGVVVADSEGKYFMFNEAAKRMTGQNMQPTEKKNLVKQVGFFLPDKKTPFPDEQLPVIRVLRGEIVNNVEMFMYNPATMQEGIHLSVSARPLYDAQGILTGGVSVSRDVTELKQAETQLRESITQLEHQTHLMQSVFDSISDGVVVADENGQFTMFNPSAERIAGMGAIDTHPDEWSEQYGLFFHDKVTLFPPEELPLALALKGEPTDDVEIFVRNPNVPDGLYVSVNGRPLQAKGEISGGVAVFRDVTEQVLAEEALTQAFAQGRLEIVETILHNIGNAINSVAVGINTLHQDLAEDQLVHRFSALANAAKAHQSDWVDYIENDPQGQQVLPFMLALAADFTDQNEQLVKIIERVRDRVTHIVDIIRTQRASHQTSSMTRKNIHLQKTILNAVKLQQDSIDKRDIQVDVDCENAPQEIWIQESQFHQMLVNLCKNSIEAIDDLIRSGGLNETPRIVIKAYTSEDFLYLDVTDNGIGIEQKNFKLIFTAGYTTKKSGTGLGLHSSANFVIGTGGKIHPLSEGIGKGTTMRITLRTSSITP